MSKEHAKKFIEQAKNDPVLRRRLNEASDHMVKLAKEHGFEVTGDEVKAALRQHWDDDPASGVLSETPGF